VARALRESQRTADIPIIVLTAKDLTGADHARSQGRRRRAIIAKASYAPEELLAEVAPRHGGHR
jgi:CheY-like chemotaxis protein